MPEVTCQRCGEEVGGDIRTLTMSCSYDISEYLSQLRVAKLGGINMYSLDICKDCRASWLDTLQRWFLSAEVKETIGSGIFVRRGGATVEITRAEWDQMHPGREPVLFLPK